MEKDIEDRLRAKYALIDRSDPTAIQAAQQVLSKFCSRLLFYSFQYLFHSYQLILSSIYTHFNTLKNKLLENIVEKGEIAENEQFHLFPLCFLCNLYLEIL